MNCKHIKRKQMNENKQKQEVSRKAIPGCQGNEVKRCILQHMYSYMFRKINKIENTFRKLETTKKEPEPNRHSRNKNYSKLY